MNKKNLGLTLVLMILCSREYIYTQTDTLTVATYSLADFPSASNSKDLTPYFTKIFREIKPDVITFQQIVKETGTSILTKSLEAGTGAKYQSAQFIDGNDSDNLLFFRTDRLILHSQKQIITALRDISRYELSPISIFDSISFYIYSLHLKAGTTKTDQSKRRAEMHKLYEDILTLPANSDYLICGDFNSQSSTDSAFYDFISFTKDENAICFDPIFAPGKWNNNEKFAYLHTQSTHEQSTGYFASGGMDDRFDIIFCSPAILTNPEYFYIENSYHAFGNDGKHFNKSINDGYNSAVSDSIANALFEASDHLPVILKIGISPTTTGILTTVYITNTGKKYHLWGCRYLDNSAHAISLEDAVRQGYTPCSVCKPPSDVKNDELENNLLNYTLFQNYPNPFNSSTTINFTLLKENEVEVQIFNIKGDLVYTFEEKKLSHGNYSIIWNGQNVLEQQCSSGIYFCQLKTNNFIYKIKLTLIR